LGRASVKGMSDQETAGPAPSATGGFGRAGGPVRQGALRGHNLGLALRIVAEAATPVSRARIAAITGLTRATASTLVDTLLAGRLVREVELPRTSRSGRPAVGLVLAPGGPGGLGLELNVDYVAATVVDLTGSVVFHEVVAADQRLLDPPEALSRTAALACAGLDAAAAKGVEVCGVALALPGLVEPGRGRLLLAPNLGWRDVDVAGLLRREPRLAALPVSLDNEANYAALAELASGPQEDAPDFVHLSGEVGIGAGIVLGGRLFRGSRGWGGEIGHVTVDPAGPPCSCGARGCLEQYAGQEAILRRAGLSGSAATSLGGEPTIRLLVQRAADGDADLLAALADAANALGVVVAGMVNLLDVGTVVLGGIYGPLAPWIQPAVEAELAGRVLWSAWAPPRVRIATKGPESAVLGAATSVVSGVLADPATWLGRGTLRA
jgi:predicted NBD/HSP70 family sugar kinase